MQQRGAVVWREQGLRGDRFQEASWSADPLSKSEGGRASTNRDKARDRIRIRLFLKTALVLSDCYFEEKRRNARLRLDPQSEGVLEWDLAAERLRNGRPADEVAEEIAVLKRLLPRSFFEKLKVKGPRAVERALGIATRADANAAISKGEPERASITGGVAWEDRKR